MQEKTAAAAYVVVCKIYLDRGSYRSAAGEFAYKCVPTKKKNKLKK